MSTTPRTIAVPLDPNQPTASYALASGLAQFVESVYIEVDGTAAGDMQPLLTLAEQSGVVIAKKRQGDAITGGTSGSATWALRLTDETARPSVSTAPWGNYWTGAIVVPVFGGAGNPVQVPFLFIEGTDILDVNPPFDIYEPGFTKSGVHTFSCQGQERTGGSFPGVTAGMVIDVGIHDPNGESFVGTDFEIGGHPYGRAQGAMTISRFVSKGDSPDLSLGHNDAAAAHTLQIFVTVQREG